MRPANADLIKRHVRPRALTNDDFQFNLISQLFSDEFSNCFIYKCLKIVKNTKHSCLGEGDEVC